MLQLRNLHDSALHPQGIPGSTWLRGTQGTQIFNADCTHQMVTPERRPSLKSGLRRPFAESAIAQVHWYSWPE
jgi:hypothetical protein